MPIAGQLNSFQRIGLPIDYVTRRNAPIVAVTSRERVCKAVQPDRLTIAVAGTPAELNLRPRPSALTSPKPAAPPANSHRLWMARKGGLRPPRLIGCGMPDRRLHRLADLAFAALPRVTYDAALKQAQMQFQWLRDQHAATGSNSSICRSAAPT